MLKHITIAALLIAKTVSMIKQLDSFSKAVELDPNYVEVYNNRGIAHYCRNDFDSAIRDFNTAIQQKPSLTEVYNNRAVAYASKFEV